MQNNAATESKEVENFFYDERFFSETTDLVDYLVDEGELNKDDTEDFVLEVDLATKEPILDIGLDWLVETITECNAERFSENGIDDEIEQIKNALKESLDFDKFNAAMPKLHYPNHKTHRFTKADLLEFMQ